MPVIRLYPSAIRPGSGEGDFTDAQLTQILGNSTNLIGVSRQYPIGAGIYGGFFFNTSVIPDGAIITAVDAGVQGYASYQNSRQFYSLAMWHPTHGTILKTGGPFVPYIEGTMALPTISYTWPVDAIKNPSIEWDFCFISTAGYYNVALYWRKAWVDITYTEGASPVGKNLLFLGENF